MTKRVGGTCAIFPFQRLKLPVALAGLWAPPVEAQRAAVRNNRAYIEQVRARVVEHAPPRDSSAWAKTEHYLHAIDEALAGCDRTRDLVEILQTPTPRRTIGDLR